jgi:hypothetical protein
MHWYNFVTNLSHNNALIQCAFHALAVPLCAIQYQWQYKNKCKRQFWHLKYKKMMPDQINIYLSIYLSICLNVWWFKISYIVSRMYSMVMNHIMYT